LYKKELPDGFIIQNTEAHHAIALDALQGIVFPTLSVEERLQAKHYLKHIELFPQGQFVVLDGDQPIAMSTTIRYHLALEDHTFLDISAALWMTTHEPDGDWLYGMDLGVHPDYQGKGIGRAIYRARQETCRILGLKGQITAGMTNGYHHYASTMTLDAYYEAIVSGQIFDPTVSMQLKMGFSPLRLIHNYLDDPNCGNGAVLMILPVEKTV
jgi:GNAT superfamily N-acetyltransferase